MKYKLLVLDVDGTLLNDAKEISKRTLGTVDYYNVSGGVWQEEIEKFLNKTDKQENSMRAGSTVWRMVRGTAPAGKRMDCETGAGLLQ